MFSPRLPSGKLLLAVSCLFAHTSYSVDAATIVKADNVDPLQNGSSWVGATAPASGDIALWDSTVTAPNVASTLSGGANWQGIQVTNPASDITIALSGGGLTLGTGGIDLSSAGSANLIITGNQAVNGTGINVNTAAGRGVTVEGNFSPVATFQKNGAGTLTLTGTTDNGGTLSQINSGVVVLAKASSGSVHALGGGLQTIANGATLRLGGTGDDQIYTDATLHVNGNFDFAGKNEGFKTLNGATTGRITNSATGTTSTVTAGENNGNGTYDGIIENGAGTVALRKVGTGVLELRNTGNTYSGGTEINGGTVRITSDGSLGAASGTVTLNGGTLMNNGSAPVLNASRNVVLGASGGALQAGWSQYLEVYGQVSGPGALRINSDSGYVYLANTNNSFGGGVTIDNAILRINSDGSLGAASGGVTLNGGTLMNFDSAPDLNSSRTITLTSAGGSFRPGWNKNITVQGQVTGVGALTVRNDGGRLVLTNTANNYAGSTLIGGSGSGNIAHLQLGASHVLPDGSAVVFQAGGTLGATSNTAYLHLNGQSETVASIETISGRGFIEGTGTLTVNTTGSKVFNGIINNSAHLIHAGSGDLTLTGEGDNAGARATVNAGTLILAKDSTSAVHSLGGAVHTVNNGGILRLAGTGNDQIYTSADVEVNSGGEIDFNGRQEGWRYLNGNGVVTNRAAATTSIMTVGEGGASGSHNTFAGSINDGAGVMALNKVGAGNFLLTGTSTLSGNTSVSGGAFGGTGSLANSKVVVGSGASLSPGAATAQPLFGAGTLRVKGVEFQNGSQFLVNLAQGGVAAQTDRLALNSGGIDILSATLAGDWEGSQANVFTGTRNASNQLWLTEGSTFRNGFFTNSSAVDDWGLFGSEQYALTTIDGLQFATFYNANYASNALSGGFDLLLIAVPEPSKAVFGLLAATLLAGRRRRLRNQADS